MVGFSRIRVTIRVSVMIRVRFCFSNANLNRITLDGELIRRILPGYPTVCTVICINYVV